MARIQRVGSLEIGQDIEFQQREWRVQRLAWLVAALVLVAGLAGVLGGGPLSRAEASSGPLALDYEWLVRQRAPTQLALRLAPATGGEIAIWIDTTFLEKVVIERIMPEPVEMAAAADRVLYRFAVAEPEQTTDVTFHLEPNEPGAVQGRLGIVGGAEVSFGQFIYP